MTLDGQGADGVIVHHGSWFAGHSLYVNDGKLCMAVMEVETSLRWDNLETTTTVVESERSLPEEPVLVEGCMESDGTVTLRVDGEVVGTGRADGALLIYPCGMLEAAEYTQTGYPPIGDYREGEDFPGTLQEITVSVGE